MTFYRISSILSTGKHLFVFSDDSDRNSNYSKIKKKDGIVVQSLSGICFVSFNLFIFLLCFHFATALCPRQLTQWWDKEPKKDKKNRNQFYFCWQYWKKREENQKLHFETLHRFSICSTIMDLRLGRWKIEERRVFIVQPYFNRFGFISHFV